MPAENRLPKTEGLKSPLQCLNQARYSIAWGGIGAALACRLGIGFVPIRKPGKLPAETAAVEYALEYGTDAIEIHADAVGAGARVLMVDDLLATGGTMAAACELVRELGGEVVAVAFLIELCFLKGREKLPGCEIHTLVRVQ